MKDCKFCHSHNGMNQFPPRYYFDKLPYGTTEVECESCNDTYEYTKEPSDKVTERLVIR